MGCEGGGCSPVAGCRGGPPDDEKGYGYVITWPNRQYVCDDGFCFVSGGDIREMCGAALLAMFQSWPEHLCFVPPFPTGGQLRGGTRVRVICDDFARGRPQHSIGTERGNMAV